MYNTSLLTIHYISFELVNSFFALIVVITGILTVSLLYLAISQSRIDLGLFFLRVFVYSSDSNNTLTLSSIFWKKTYF